MKTIGTPPQEVAVWLQSFAAHNQREAHRAFWFWNRMKYDGQAWAFSLAAELIGRAQEGDDMENGMKARLYRGKDGEWRFTIVAENGEPVAQSEGYERKIDARSMAVQLVGEDNIEAEEVE